MIWQSSSDVNGCNGPDLVIDQFVVFGMNACRRNFSLWRVHYTDCEKTFRIGNVAYGVGFPSNLSETDSAGYLPRNRISSAMCLFDGRESRVSPTLSRHGPQFMCQYD